MLVEARAATPLALGSAADQPRGDPASKASGPKNEDEDEVRPAPGPTELASGHSLEDVLALMILLDRDDRARARKLADIQENIILREGRKRVESLREKAESTFVAGLTSGLLQGLSGVATLAGAALFKTPSAGERDWGKGFDGGARSIDASAAIAASFGSQKAHEHDADAEASKNQAEAAARRSEQAVTEQRDLHARQSKLLEAYAELERTKAQTLLAAIRG